MTLHFSTESYTDAAARFASELSLDSVPPEIAGKARACLLYGLGIGLACVDSAYGRIARHALEALDGAAAQRGGATVLATGARLPLSAAAFSNAAMMHGRCQEDTCGSAHLGVAILPCLLALIEADKAPAANLLPALIAGYETAGRIEARLSRASTARGLRASPLYGTLAAAVAAARAMDLPADRMRAAIANAAAFSGGTLQAIAEGTDEWRYQMGASVRRGLEAAMLARVGAIGAREPLEGALGFAQCYAQTPLDGFDSSPWVLPTVAFKLYPICNRNQTAALLAAHIHGRVAPERIERIRIRINPNVLAGMLERGPFTMLGQTLMSTYFSCATALATGTITLRALTDFDAARVAGLIGRMTIDTDAAVPYPSAEAEVQTIEGERLAFSEIRTFEDYSFSREQVNTLLGGLAEETGVPPEAMRMLDRYAYGQTFDSVEPVLQAYATGRAPFVENG
ncbi:MAG TPA: MmgE/PrpD family protein [Bordetella sp.]